MPRFATLLFVCIVLSLDTNADESWQRHTIDPSDQTSGKLGADGVRLDDANGDGLLDIATPWEEGGAVAVYLNPGPNSATRQWPSVTVGMIPGVEDAVLVDLDADGAVDVVSCAEGMKNQVFVHWAPKDEQMYLHAASWTTDGFPTSIGRRWMFALPMDMNGDGRLDLVIGAKNHDAIVGWLENPRESRDVTKWRLHELCAAGWVMSLRACDIDHDNDVDIIFSDRVGSTSGIYWLENPSDPTRNWMRRPIGGRDREVMFLTIGDLRGGNAKNLVCSTLNGVLLSYVRDAKGDWSEDRISLPFGLRSGKGVAMADVNLDGRPDLVTTSEAQRERASMVAVAWKEQTDAGWVDHTISDQHGRKFDRLEMIDLDGDGDLDLVTCEERDNLGVIWYENPTR